MKKYLLSALILPVLFSCKKKINNLVVDKGDNKPGIQWVVYDQRFIDSLSKVMAETITADDLKEHVSVLASDAYEGRGTGHEGGVKAANYIKNYFINTKIASPAGRDYLQECRDLDLEVFNNVSILDSKTSLFGKPVTAIPGADFNGFIRQSFSMQSQRIAFMGFGVEDEDHNDFEGIDDLTGTIALIDYDLPRTIPQERRKEWSLQERVSILKTFGCIGVIVKNATLGMPEIPFRRHSSGGDYELPVVGCNLVVANAILAGIDLKYPEAINKISSTGVPLSKVIEGQVNIVQEYTPANKPVYNVIAKIEGTDLKDQHIVVSAHYDHLGKSGDLIYNGADDNASGAASIMEIAEAFQAAVNKGFKPRRSVVFIGFGAEEYLLQGSAYYVNNPWIPLNNTVANINIDMVGRVDNAHIDNENYVYIVGTPEASKQLLPVNEKIAQQFSMLKLEKGESRDLERSDQENFRKKGIPVLFYFDGGHAEYHKPEDKIDLLNFPVHEKRTRLAFHLIWQLAYTDQPIK